MTAQQTLLEIAALAAGAVGRHLAPKAATAVKKIKPAAKPAAAPKPKAQIEISGTQRELLVAMGRYLIARQAQVHYAQTRSSTDIMSSHGLSFAQVQALFSKGGSITMDCSEAVTTLFRWADLKDPNGLGYDGYGYTGTLLQHLPHFTDTNEANPGTIVIFGAYPGEHACMVLEHDKTNPLLFSHGSEADPRAIRLHDEAAAHAGQPITYLAIKDL